MTTNQTERCPNCAPNEICTCIPAGHTSQSATPALPDLCEHCAKGDHKLHGVIISSSGTRLEKCYICECVAAVSSEPLSAEATARLFHETYERLAPEFGYETRKESAVPWEQVPEKNRKLMIAVCAHVTASLEQRIGELENELGIEQIKVRVAHKNLLPLLQRAATAERQLAEAQKDNEANKRDWNLLAQEMGCENTREEMLKWIRQRKS